MALAHKLRHEGLFDEDRPAVFQAWSPGAVEWALPLSTGHRPLLVMVGPEDDCACHAHWASQANVHFVCSSPVTRRKLLAAGVAPARVAVLLPLLSLDAIRPVSRGDVRARLGLSESDDVILVLPPVTRGAGAFIAVWASFLVEKLRPTVRVIIPDSGPEALRIQRLAQACRHEQVTCFAPEIPLSALLAAADMAAYLPPLDASVDVVAQAARHGCPLMLTNTPVVQELLPEDAAWWCRANDPEDGARQIIAALENPDQSRLQAERAQAAIIGRFDVAQLTERWQHLYAKLEQRMPVGV